MYSRMLAGAILAFISVLPSCAMPGERDTGLQGLERASMATARCSKFFEERIQASLSKKQIDGSSAHSLAMTLLSNLPEVEVAAIRAVAARTTSETDTLTIREELRGEFIDKRLCAEASLISQIEIFANALSVYLLEEGLVSRSAVSASAGALVWEDDHDALLRWLVNAAR